MITLKAFEHTGIIDTVSSYRVKLRLKGSRIMKVGYILQVGCENY